MRRCPCFAVSHALLCVTSQERTLAPTSDKFWFVARAVAEFVDNEGDGSLPLCAELADVTSTTEWYMRLQRIYSDKVPARRRRPASACTCQEPADDHCSADTQAAADCAVVKERVRALEAATGVETRCV